MDRTLLSDLAEEQAALDALLAGLSEGDWARPTPAEGWTIADTIRHLAVSEQAALSSVQDDRDPFQTAAAAPEATASRPHPERPASPDGPDLRAWWAGGCERVRAAFAHCPDSARVPWGGRRMAARTLATARLMECWAHGLDCFAAIGRTPVDTDRLRHVAWLGWKSLPHAFAIAGIDPPRPPACLRLELEAPSGATWQFGPPSSTEVITGGGGDWCRVVTHRLRPPATSTLQRQGALADAAVGVARAFL